jgi:hypothetical protein
MLMSFDLTEDVVQQLKVMPNIDDFVNQVIKKALQSRMEVKKQPSKWALLVQEIENNPSLQLNGYSEQLKKDMREVRENFFFANDE